MATSKQLLDFYAFEKQIALLANGDGSLREMWDGLSAELDLFDDAVKTNIARTTAGKRRKSQPQRSRGEIDLLAQIQGLANGIIAKLRAAKTPTLIPEYLSILANALANADAVQAFAHALPTIRAAMASKR